MFQSTPPHGERLKSPSREPWQDFVSIHAPAWGATRYNSIIKQTERFQSTPPHGERHIHILRNLNSLRFQSTPPHGERQDLFYIPTGRSSVSIHAPAWGATKTVSRMKARTKFQSTPPHGERHLLPEILFITMLFQSTPPHGERPHLI